MRHLLTATLMTAFSAQALAATLNFQDVTARICDGVQQKTRIGDRVAVQPEGYLVIGETLADGCRVADFHTILVTGWTVNNNKKTSNIILAPLPVQRKSSCSSQLKEVPSHFQSAVYSENKIVFKGGPDCKTLELELSAK